MRILIWDVHGGYTDALLQVPAEFWYLCDETAKATEESMPELGPLMANGLRRRCHDRPSNAVEVSLERLRDEPPDVVVAQRLEEVDVLPRLLGREPGIDIGAIFLEHNTPKGRIPDTRHPLAGRQGWHLVHVTHFNQLMWDNGDCPTTVIEHGLPDPGYRYTGELDRLAFVVNEPVRRWRTTGTDLLPEFAETPVDAYGIDGDQLLPVLGSSCPRLAFGGNLSSAELCDQLARHRAYLHLTRWTSLGLSLINAMMLGLPVIALGTTEAYRAVPADAGACSTDVDELVDAARTLVREPELARRCGQRAREYALDRFGLERFVAAWSDCLADLAGVAQLMSSSSTSSAR